MRARARQHSPGAARARNRPQGAIFIDASCGAPSARRDGESQRRALCWATAMPQAPANPAQLDCDAWRRALAERLEVARAGREAEGVHGLRVACARLDVFLRLAGRRALRDDLRWLRRAASSVRDFNVLLSRELPAEFRKRLAEQCEPARATLEAALGDERCEALLAGLESVPPIAMADARARVEKLRQRVAERGAEVERTAGSVDALHALRRRLRRLRYAHEWLDVECKPLRRMHDELGALNDSVVTLARLDELFGLDELADYRDELKAEVAQHTQSALRAWSELRPPILEETT